MRGPRSRIPVPLSVCHREHKLSLTGFRYVRVLRLYNGDTENEPTTHATHTHMHKHTWGRAEGRYVASDAEKTVLGTGIRYLQSWPPGQWIVCVKKCSGEQKSVQFTPRMTTSSFVLDSFKCCLTITKCNQNSGRFTVLQFVTCFVICSIIS